MLFLIIEGFKKKSPAISENNSRTLLLKRRRTAPSLRHSCETSQSTSSSTVSSGLAEPLLKARTRLRACGWEPNKMRFQICLGWTKKLTFFPERKKETVFKKPLLKERTMWGEEGSLHTYMHTLTSSHILQSFTRRNLPQTGQTTFTEMI